VKGDIVVDSGNLYINNGSLVAENDLRIQAKNSDGTYGYSIGNLNMTNANDKVTVNGSFYMQGQYDQSSSLTNGALEVKRNFSQIGDINSFSRSNFNASGNHKVVLSGISTQRVSFDTPDYSGFNILVLNKDINTGYEFSKIPCWRELYLGTIKNYIVTFDSNEGSTVAIQAVPAEAKSSIPQQPTKASFTFGGWYKENTFVNLFDIENTPITENITLYAKWNIITGLTVKVTAINGSISGVSESYKYGGIVILTALPVEDYIFHSWTDKAGNILSTNQTYVFNITDNVELNANFTDIYDINKDGRVSIEDLALVAQNYSTRGTDANWNSEIDFNKDGKVDIFDLVICSKKIK
jgi:uncharacterized repeat protein (TIGR02543 family)